MPEVDRQGRAPLKVWNQFFFTVLLGLPWKFEKDVLYVELEILQMFLNCIYHEYKGYFSFVYLLSLYSFTICIQIMKIYILLSDHTYLPRNIFYTIHSTQYSMEMNAHAHCCHHQPAETFTKITNSFHSVIYCNNSWPSYIRVLCSVINSASEIYTVCRRNARDKRSWGTGRKKMR